MARRSRFLITAAAVAGAAVAVPAQGLAANDGTQGVGSDEVASATMTYSGAVAPTAAAVESRGRRVNGRIMFQGYVDRTPQVFTVRRDGTGRRQLTRHGVNNNPDWSPSGRRIVYGHWGDDGDNELFVMWRNGSHKRQITHNHRLDINPVWSPSAHRIAYNVWDGNDMEIFTVRPDGSGTRRLTNNTVDDLHPDWSPTGRWIAFDGFDGDDQEIYRISPSGENRRQPVTNNLHNDWTPSFSPSGTRVAYGSQGGEIFVKRIDGGPRHQVTDNRQYTFTPTWSPNGKRIAYMELHGQRGNIYTIKVSGHAARQVTHSPLGKEWPDWGRAPAR